MSCSECRGTGKLTVNTYNIDGEVTRVKQEDCYYCFEREAIQADHRRDLRPYETGETREFQELVDALTDRM